MRLDQALDVGTEPSTRPATFKSRLGDRRNLAFHGVLLVGWGAIWGLRAGDSIAFVLAMIAAVVILEFGAVYGLRFISGRRELRRRAMGHPPGWPAALMAVLQARQAGFEIVGDYRNDTVVRGRLTAEGDRWSWTAKPNRKHPLGATITLDAGWAPAMANRIGYRHILTFTDTRAQRLDLLVAPRRDLRRYLSGVR
jgi:hypothetical protein